MFLAFKSIRYAIIKNSKSIYAANPSYRSLSTVGKPEIKTEILEKALGHVNMCGWSDLALANGSHDIG